MTPNTTWNIIGHDWAVKLLQQQIKRDEIRHAYLITGMQGTGRRTLGVRFMQALNCQSPVAAGVPCGTCRTCRQIEQMQYADLFIVRKEEERTRIIIEQIRQLQHDLSLAPIEGKYRFGLCLNFEIANEASQNAFLKTLEEAPEKDILVITADSVEALLPTIVSRCEVIRLRPMPVDKLAQELAAKWQLTGEESRLLAHISQGCPGTALNLHAFPEILNKRKDMIKSSLDLFSAPLWERFSYADGITKKSAQDPDSQMILRVWLSIWSDILHLKTRDGNPLINIDVEESLQELSEQIPIRTIKQCLRQHQQAFQKMDQNVNFKMLTEVLLLDWPRMQP